MNTNTQTCPAIKPDGAVCGKKCRNDVRCLQHMKVLNNNGPHTLALKELGYKQRAQLRDIVRRFENDILEEHDDTRKDRLEEDLKQRIDFMKLEHRREKISLMRSHEDEIRRTGIDPDEEPRRRRTAELLHRRELARQAIIARIAAHNQEVRAGIGGLMEERVQQRELEAFANDNQNVHTTVIVKQTKDIIDRLLKIHVPEDYRWNLTTCSKTPGDIILQCNLTPKGTWQMSAKYCQDENIYEMGNGIYGKVLDAVWQYILNSPDKEDLCKILKQEMEDNVGMCAQGNLTRLCNILVGYMEGVGPIESVTETLGRKLPLLLKIEDQEERIKEAHKLMLELGIPEDQWLSWVEPLVDEGTLKLKSTGAGQVVGFMVV